MVGDFPLLKPHQEPESLKVNKHLVAEAVGYFQQKGFSRLLDLMTQKYRNLGRWAGAVKLPNLNPEEQEFLSSFFRRDYRHQNNVTISLEDFAKALEQTKFAGIPVLTIMEGLYGGALLTRTQEGQEREKARSEYLTRLRSAYPQEYCQKWLTAIEERTEGTRSVQAAYEKDAGLLLKQMHQVLSALTELENGRRERLCQEAVVAYENSTDDRREQHGEYFERLPVFAQRITKNPHGFDPDTETGRLFIHALTVLRRHVEANGDMPSSFKLHDLPNSEQPEYGETMKDSANLSGGEALNELFYHFGLLRDDLWNFVTCAGIVARDVKGRDLPVWSAACKEGVALNVPLREIVKVRDAYSAHDPHGLKKRVYVVENPAVFSALLDESDKKNQAYPALICTHGQFKLAALLLMDKLVAGGVIIKYSGDFDPEGLLMAESLIKRYPGCVIPWHYNKKAYEFSEPEQQISSLRLKKLEAVQSPELSAVKGEILKSGQAGYQEGIIPLLWMDFEREVRVWEEP